MSESPELRRLRAENQALERAVNTEEAKIMAKDYARMKNVLADVHSAMLFAGWKDDELIRRVRQEVRT